MSCPYTTARKNDFHLRIQADFAPPVFSAKNISFFFSETMLLCGHPASLRGALRAIVTTREAGMRWTFGSRQTNTGRRT